MCLGWLIIRRITFVQVLFHIFQFFECNSNSTPQCLFSSHIFQLAKCQSLTAHYHPGAVQHARVCPTAATTPVHLSVHPTRRDLIFRYLRTSVAFRSHCSSFSATAIGRQSYKYWKTFIMTATSRCLLRTCALTSTRRSKRNTFYRGCVACFHGLSWRSWIACCEILDFPVPVTLAWNLVEKRWDNKVHI